MIILTSTLDNKISATNHLIETNIGQYASIAKAIIENNELQRRRVKSANRTYSLLKDDIKFGCVIPPIVLAIFPRDSSSSSDITKENLISTILQAGESLIILDGLQRTYTILDLISELSESPDILEKVKNLPLRLEVYTGISKVGVLYRMLTLNTGQTPMSTRHQVEILYSDYKSGVDGLTFLSESDNRIPSGDSEFKFSDVLDGFLSYITGNYFPIDREDLVSIIKNLESLTKEDKQKDLFRLLISTYNSLRLKLNELEENWEFEENGVKLVKRPFGRTFNDIFAKVQVMAGFGAAISFLIENRLLKDIETLKSLVTNLENNNIKESFNLLVKNLDEIQVSAKKIGNEQRMYFYYFFRLLFNVSSDAYLKIDQSVVDAFKFYKANTLA